LGPARCRLLKGAVAIANGVTEIVARGGWSAGIRYEDEIAVFIPVQVSAGDGERRCGNDGAHRTAEGTVSIVYEAGDGERLTETRRGDDVRLTVAVHVDNGHQNDSIGVEPVAPRVGKHSLPLIDDHVHARVSCTGAAVVQRKDVRPLVAVDIDLREH